MLSPRVWLERFPLPLRLFVALMAVLSFVAPTWHICSLGEHATAHAAHGRQHGRTFMHSESGALICVCAPSHRQDKFPVPLGAQLNGRATHDTTCLALLLASMPALAVCVAQPVRIVFVRFPLWFPTRLDFPAREFIRTFSGRGPPVCVCLSP